MTFTPVQPPSADTRSAAAARLAGLATPPGALGRLGELGVWWCAVTNSVPPPAVERVRAVVFAGDHGVATHGVSAFPTDITQAMVRTMHAGRAGVTALARAHDVSVRVVDVSVDVEHFDAIDPVISAHKIRRGAGAIHLEDAMSLAEAQDALSLGARLAREDIEAGAQLLISGDMGIGNTTPATALIAAVLEVAVDDVVGRGTGIDDAGLARKTTVIETAIERTRGVDDPAEILAALGSPDIAAAAGYLAESARLGVPALLDGLIGVASALLADRIAPGAAAWFAAGHRSTEAAQSVGLKALGLEPILDLGMRLGEGSGAVAAVPVLRSAAALMSDMALLADLQ